MNEGYLSAYFAAVAAKRLSAVEADTARSHQHEFNGTSELKMVLGTGTGEKVTFPASFVWLGQENEAVSSDGFVTWYDSRRNHPTRSEYRLYFPTTDVSELAQAGDLMLIARRTDGSVMIIVTAAGTTIENQLLWLFGLPSPEGSKFTLNDIQDGKDREVDFAVRFILEELGIDVEEPETDYLDSLLERFQGKFPKTAEFSLYARQTLKDVSPFEEPDRTLMAWMEHEEKLFRRLERQIVEQRLQSGFISGEGADVEGFINFSLSVQNRRKSRAGLALENHLEELFRAHSISYSRVAETENRAKPDFLFPSGAAYHNPAFPPTLLTMLGVKTTCKDRWRQVLSEAARIEDKHLFTLEPGISENQTSEMQAQRLQLVLPTSIHDTYRPSQRSWLMSLSDFIAVAGERQATSIASGF
ncbi:type II restriction endonuclease [Arsenicibacter rosenii]|uniref:Restriction endonuclease n=1 Tax=Arsenicibacter rosenii TaxID=1750698 RepID=A0A1S2VAQ5_9BACT|nr:type II restriction endonuclease [Arsenicibacter rosenii]OIN55772.1 restriction endonuclease [Arsenicibacter rosenii]